MAGLQIFRRKDLVLFDTVTFLNLLHSLDTGAQELILSLLPVGYNKAPPAPICMPPSEHWDYTVAPSVFNLKWTFRLHISKLLSLIITQGMQVVRTICRQLRLAVALQLVGRVELHIRVRGERVYVQV